MKWRNKPEPQVGDIRSAVVFAFLPVVIGTETFWLEKVVEYQKYYLSGGWRVAFYSEYMPSHKKRGEEN